MSGSSLAAVSSSGPNYTPIEPNASEPPDPGVVVCVDKASEGGRGASGAGTEALVRRFSDSSGSGGASGYVERAATPSDSCADEALGALAVCGALALSGSGTAGVMLLLGGLKCAADVSGLVECLENQNAASEP
jgi:hypothetical protein